MTAQEIRPRRGVYMIHRTIPATAFPTRWSGCWLVCVAWLGLFAIALGVNASPPVITGAPQGAFVAEGEVLQLSVTAAGTGLTYQWKKDGSAIPGATSSLFLRVHADPTDSGTYIAVVQNGDGIATSEPVGVTIGAPKPRVSGGVIDLRGLPVPADAWKDVVAISAVSGVRTNSPYDSTVSYERFARLAVFADGRVAHWGYTRTLLPPTWYPGIGRPGDNASVDSFTGWVGVASDLGVLDGVAGIEDWFLVGQGRITDQPSNDARPTDPVTRMVAVAGASDIGSDGYAKPYILGLRNTGSVSVVSPTGVPPPPDAVASGILSIAAGPGFGVALRVDGTVVAWNSATGTRIPTDSAFSGPMRSIATDTNGFGGVRTDGTLIFQSVAGSVLTIPPQPGIEIATGTPSFAISADHRAVTWDGTHWVPAPVPAWTQGRILKRSGETLLLRPEAPVIVRAPLDTTVSLAQPLQLEVEGGGMGLTYQWLRDGQKLLSATNRILTVDPPVIGTYTVTLSNGLGSVTSEPGAKVSVVPREETGSELLMSAPWLDMPVVMTRDLQKVSAGAFHILTLDVHGAVHGWMIGATNFYTNALNEVYPAGRNYGQSLVPKEVQSGVLDICAMGDQSAALKADGSVVQWGDGIPYGTVRQSPPARIRQMDFVSGAYLNSEGSVLGWEPLGNVFYPLGPKSGTLQVANGYALQSDGSVIPLFGQNIPPGARSDMRLLSHGGFRAVSQFGIKRDGTLVWWQGGVLKTFAKPVTDALDLFFDNYQGLCVLRRPGLLARIPWNEWDKGELSTDSIPPDWQGNVVQFATGLFLGQEFALVPPRHGQLRFRPLVDQTLSAPMVPLQAVSLRGLPVRFRVTSGPATLMDQQLKLSGKGSVTVVAEEVNLANPSDAETAAQTFNVHGVSQYIQWDAFGFLQNPVYDSKPVDLGVFAVTGLPVTVELLDGPATLSGQRLTLTGSGTLKFRFSVPGSDLYEPASGEYTFVVQRAPQRITWLPSALPNRYVPGLTIEFSPTSDSGLPVGLRVVSGPAKLVGTTLEVQGTGSVFVAAEQPGNASYLPVSEIRRFDFPGAVPLAYQTITFDPWPEATTPGWVGNIQIPRPPLLVTATSNYGLPVKVAVESGPAAFDDKDGNRLSFSGSGYAVLTASQEGDATTAAGQARAVLLVTETPTVQTIDFLPLPELRVDSPVTLSATSSSGASIRYNLYGAGWMSGNVLTPTLPGSLTVYAIGYNDDPQTSWLGQASQTVTVLPALQTIQFNGPGDVEFRSTPVVLTALSSRGLPVRFRVLGGPATLNGDQLTLTGVGMVTVAADQGGDAKSAAAPTVTRSFSVIPGVRVITAAAGSGGNPSLRVILPAGLDAVLEQGDLAGHWIQVSPLRGLGADTPLVVPFPDGGGASNSRFLRVTVSP